MNRVIIKGKNNELPQNAMQSRLVVCMNCNGTGFDWGFYTNDPSEKAHRFPCECCNGQGVREKFIEPR